MIIKISEEYLRKCSLTINEFLYLFILQNKGNFKEIEKSLVNKRAITSNESVVILTKRGLQNIDFVLGKYPKSIDYEGIAKKLQEIYPKGKKLGTNCMWRDSTAMIARKLRTLVEKYNCNFTEEQAIKATTSYVNSFKGDYTYMQVLKYFLLKTKTSNDAERDVTSEFMSRLENEDCEDDLREDWITTLK